MVIVEDHPYFSHPGKRVLKAVYDQSLEPVTKYPEETIIPFLLDRGLIDHPVSFSFTSLKGYIQKKHNLTLHKLEIEKFILEPLVDKGVIKSEKKSKMMVYHTDFNRIIMNAHTPKIDDYRDRYSYVGPIRWIKLLNWP